MGVFVVPFSLISSRDKTGQSAAFCFPFAKRCGFHLPETGISQERSGLRGGGEGGGAPFPDQKETEQKLIPKPHQKGAGEQVRAEFLQKYLWLQQILLYSIVP